MTLLKPNWPAPASVHACTTLRTATDNNTTRDHFKQMVEPPEEPIWLKQVHGNIAIEALPEHREQKADATFTHQSNRVCAIITADCIPILFCDSKGTHVAAAHAGWRGLNQGIIENTIAAMKTPSSALMAWLGPAISQRHYEIGEEVRDLFLQQDQKTEKAFIPSSNEGHWLADLYEIARIRLREQGISAIYGGEFCTYSEPDRFYSYRRADTGRMASFIWIG